MEYDKIENESASIGAIADVSPLKLAGAYAAFGNEGMYNKPHTVKKIILKDNETEIVNKVSPQLAMKDSTAFMVTSMLKDVISSKAKLGQLAVVQLFLVYQQPEKQEQRIILRKK